MKISSIACAGAVAFALSGCATVVNGPNIDYAVDTNPTGATVSFYGNGATCETPCERELKRANHTRLDFSMDGYEPAYVLVQSKVGAATVGNVLAGGIIGAVVDSSNGSNRFLSPRPLIVRLAPVGSGQDAVLLDKDGEVIATVTAHNDEVREKVAEQIGNEAAGLTKIAAQ